MEKDKKTEEYLLKPFFKVYLFLSLNGKKRTFSLRKRGSLALSFSYNQVNV